MVGIWKKIINYVKKLFAVIKLVSMDLKFEVINLFK